MHSPTGMGGPMEAEVDYQEFSEIIVRLAIYYMPGDFDCRGDAGVAKALEALLLYVCLGVTVTTAHISLFLLSTNL